MSSKVLERRKVVSKVALVETLNRALQGRLTEQGEHARFASNSLLKLRVPDHNGCNWEWIQVLRGDVRDRESALIHAATVVVEAEKKYNLE